VLLVSPPCQDPGGLADWFPAPIDAEAVAAAATATRLFCSDDDPFCPAGATAAYATPLRLPVDLVAGGGHLNADAGFGPWPAVEAWAYGAKNGVEM
jgi:predicted alpha/beta hydrolase family esterase